MRLPQEGWLIFQPHIIKQMFDQTPSSTFDRINIQNPVKNMFVRLIPICKTFLRQQTNTDKAATHDAVTIKYNQMIKLKKLLL